MIYLEILELNLGLFGIKTITSWWLGLSANASLESRESKKNFRELDLIFRRIL